MVTVESETAQAVTEKATMIKATEEKSVSSVAEAVLKHEAVQTAREAHGAGEFRIEELY